MVALGKLDKVWNKVPEDASPEEFKESFYNIFGSKWENILDAAEKSFEYNSYNNAYFSVKDIQPLENMTLDRLLEREENKQPPNIVVS